MKRRHVVTSAVSAVALIAACSPSEHHATGPLESICKSALGGSYLNAAPTTVGEVRTAVPGGPPDRQPPLRDAFPGAKAADPAVWCWAAEPTAYRLYAVVAGGKPQFFEGIGGVHRGRPPSPGPAAIP